MYGTVASSQVSMKAFSEIGSYVVTRLTALLYSGTPCSMVSVYTCMVQMALTLEILYVVYCISVWGCETVLYRLLDMSAHPGGYFPGARARLLGLDGGGGRMPEKLRVTGAALRCIVYM